MRWTRARSASAAPKQPAGGLDLAQKALTTDGGRRIRSEHLDRHLAMMFEIVGQADRGHSAAAEFAQDTVAVRE
jgi:hypothetical protein